MKLNLRHYVPLEMPFHMVCFFVEVKFFIFWPKTMDYNKAFLPKLRCFSAVLLLHSGRCYEAEICAIMFLLRCPFIWYPFFAEVKIFIFWPKTMDYRISSNRPRPRKERAGELVSSEIERALEYTAQDVLMYKCTQS